MANVKNKSVKTKNEVEVAGVVKENKLIVDKDKVNGSLVIQYGSKVDQQAEIKMYINRLKDEKDSNGKKTGKQIENKKYDTAKEWATNLISTAKSTEEKPASVVRVYGKGDFTPSINLNEYCNENTDDIISNIELSLGFGNVYEGDIPKEQFKAEFDMIVYLNKNPKKQEKDGKEILVIEGLYIDYQGAVKPVEFTVEDEELIEGIEECKKGDTVNLWGSCKVAHIVETKEKKSGFGGKAKTETKTFTQRQLLVEGGDPIDEDDKLAIDSDFIKKALIEREAYLEELKNKNKKDNKSKGKGGFGAGSISDGDIPF
ncbi:hypothetical protein CF086_17445 [Clostridium botulinum]|uniref:hypothetical protein n=1 Tax=Clostridium botulinum TaxID=1491 RepID=UPI0007737E82|nr:hypothetical protein [Clostridium botulinum]MBN3352083.1 hypothetical protein [Clostridium botulinum]